LSGGLVVNHKAAAFVNGLVLGLNSCGCLLGGFKLNVSEAVEIVVSYIPDVRKCRIVYPLLNPLASEATNAFLTVP
jgi:hypothetical protein